MIIGKKLLLALALGTSSVSATADIVDSTVDSNNDAKDAVTPATFRKKKKNRNLNRGKSGKSGSKYHRGSYWSSSSSSGKSGKSGGHGRRSWSSSSGDMYWYKDGKPYSSGWVSLLFCSGDVV